MGYTNYAGYDPAGVQAISATSAATASAPVITASSAASANRSQPDYAIFIAEGASARWRDDGTLPTGAIGMPLPANTPFYYDGRVDRIQFAANAGQSIIVWASLYRAGN